MRVGQGAGSTARADADWRAVRDAADIQYVPLAEPKVVQPEGPPEWLKALGRFLEAVFEPIGRLLGMSWPVFQWVLIAIGACLALFLLWRLVVEPLLDRRRNRAPEVEEVHWTPDRAEAVALLEDADRLAREGRYGEAAHLLLRRSVRQIRDTRPDWLSASSTAREIAVLPRLPEAGRRAFAVIATRVERAVFALRDLDADDWNAARSAYAQFAQIELRA
ncbi:hypothetical protein [Novosphingobium sp. AP12]|uniref:hypothetical protein n=1 Tax=Novosphingobium sp. AP12 TaxID=1144305 RepID=UPI000271ED0E|nr:hypothetical protein [Novosphingobium sp. AP12]EJL21719.1 hypothetical protein PMI02_05003 [Novosphingobium sp. AP12]